MKKNIVLCGFMGSGKSTIGKLTAEKLGARFIDTDAYIEKRENMTISEIFKVHGEEYFRNLELEVCNELSEMTKTVISTGGGTMLRDENVKALKKNGIVFLLNVSPNVVLTRLNNDTSRPLLMRPDKKKAVTELLSNRLPLYNRAADYIMDGEESPRKLALRMISIYNNDAN